jgi:hypothetical protein
MYDYLVLSNVRGITSDEDFKIIKQIESYFGQNIIEFRKIDLPHGVFDQNSGDSYILKTRDQINKQNALKLKIKAGKKGWDFHIKGIEEVV